MRIELTTSSLPRKCSTTEPQRPFSSALNWSGRRGSNSPPIAWKAIALPNELLPRFRFTPNQKNFRKSCQSYYFFCGQSRVRTYVLVREQIYSLSPLTTRPSARKPFRAGNGTRTRDLLITNQLLYQLSYSGLLRPNKRTVPIFWDGKGNGILYLSKF